MRQLHIARQHVLRGHARHVHRILGRAEGRRVGKFEFGEVLHRHVALDGGGKNVNPLVHAVVADRLRAEQSTGVRREQNLHGNRLGAGIVACVRTGMQMERLKRNARLAQRFLVRASATGGEVEQPQNRRALRALVARGATKNVVRRDAALTIRWTRQRNDAPRAGHAIPHFHCVADGVNLRIARLHGVVRANSTERTEFQPGVFRQRGFRSHSQPKHHRIRFDAPAALEHHDGGAGRFAGLRRFKCSDRIAEV